MFFVTSDVIGQAGSAAPQPRTVPGLPRSQPVARSPVPGPSRSQRASRSPVPGPHLVYRRKASAVGPREDRVWLGFGHRTRAEMRDSPPERFHHEIFSHRGGKTGDLRDSM